MKLQAFYSPRFAHKAFRMRPCYITRKDSWKPAWVGVWVRLGWPYFSVGIKFT